MDLKSSSGRDLLLQLIPNIDVLIDPFRRGVLEKLGLSPKDVLLKWNPRLIVARLTGFRQDGKYLRMAGHDLNYLAVSGVLSMLGPSVKASPLQQSIASKCPRKYSGRLCGWWADVLCWDPFGRGGTFPNEEGPGGGVSYIATAPRLSTKVQIPGQWDRLRGNNLTDGGCLNYNVYECRDDGKYMAVAALEPQFFGALTKGLGVSDEDWGGPREDRSLWPKVRQDLGQKFRSKTRREWEDIFDGTDACCTPVFDHAEMEANGYEQRAAVTLSGAPSLPDTDGGWTANTRLVRLEERERLHGGSWRIPIEGRGETVIVIIVSQRPRIPFKHRGLY